MFAFCSISHDKACQLVMLAHFPNVDTVVSISNCVQSVVLSWVAIFIYTVYGCDTGFFKQIINPCFPIEVGVFKDILFVSILLLSRLMANLGSNLLCRLQELLAVLTFKRVKLEA